MNIGLNLDFRHIAGYEYTISGNEVPDKIGYGVSVNDGQVTLQDRDDTLKGLYVSQVFTNDLPIRLYFNNKQQGVFYSSNVDYSIENRELSFELDSKIVSFLDENVKAYELPLSAGFAVTKTAKEILEEILGDTPYLMGSETTAEFVKRTYTYPMHQTTTKYDMLNSLLKTALSVLYENKEGEIVIKYVG